MTDNNVVLLLLVFVFYLGLFSGSKYERNNQQKYKSDD